MHGSRRSHRKSRDGCTNCKRRKIKCDEYRPSCGNCVKHSIACDYATRPLNGFTQESASRSLVQQVSDGTIARSTTSSDSPRPQNGAQLNVADLELLHNYCISTAFTMSGNNELRNLWRINVPQLGFSHDFVMRAILAVSALHLAHCRPERKEYYIDQATEHQDTALRAATTQLADANPDNCNALFIFTAMAFVYSLASPKVPRDFLLTRDEGVTDWLSLIRGARVIIQPSWRWLEEGPVGPMFKINMKNMDALQMKASSIFFPEFKSLVLSSAKNPHEFKIYEDTLDLLSPIFNTVYGTGWSRDYTEIISFIYRLEDEFLTNLIERKSEALAILAYYCVLLKRIDHFWWIGNWGISLLARIYELLDAEHRLWIAWPIEEIGWIPK